MAAVLPATRKSYLARWADFLLWWRLQKKGRAQKEPQNPHLDRAVCEWMDHEYLSGEQAERGSRMIAVVRHLRPAFSRGGTLKTPLALQALQGWRRRAPGRMRTPLPYEVVCLIALRLLEGGSERLALMVMVMFAAYLRPSEAAGLQPRHLVAPLPGTRYHCWSLVIHPFEEGRGSKTNEHDEAIVLSAEYLRFLDGPLARLKHASAPGPLFGVTQLEASRRFSLAARGAGLEVLEPEFYQLRHSGPSFEMLTGMRSLQEIKLRGRWHSDRSVPRYQKEGRVAEQLGRLAPPVRAAALAAPPALAAALARPSALSGC